MSSRILFLLFSFFSFFTMSVGQITLTNATFPAAGDTLRTASDVSPDSVVIDPPGGPYTWDYSWLSADSRLVTTFQPAANGAAYAKFPSAELVSINDLGAETYYDVSATLFANLGISGGDITNAFPFVTELKFVPPLPERRAPTHFFDINQSTSDFSFAIALSDLPGGLLDSLGIPSGLFDSMRVRVTFDRLDVVDAFGTMAIPGGTYNVLRQHSTNYTSTSLDVHTLFGWVDIGSLGFPIDGLGTDTTTTYGYYSDTAKEPIAIVTTTEPNGLVPAEVEYKDNGIPNAIDFENFTKADVSVSPNPTTELVLFEIKNENPVGFTLRLYDMLGHVVASRTFKSNQEDVGVGSWTGGIYLYQINDKQNRVVASGKLIKAQ